MLENKSGGLYGSATGFGNSQSIVVQKYPMMSKLRQINVTFDGVVRSNKLYTRWKSI